MTTVKLVGAVVEACPFHSGSISRNHVGTHGHLSCLTTHVKIYDFKSRSLLSGEAGLGTICIILGSFEVQPF